MRFVILLLLFFVGLHNLLHSQEVLDKGIFIKVDDAQRSVSIFFDGKYFTSYIYPESLEKPVLYPLTTAYGTVVTRGFPLQPRSGERIDHPHQVGWWLNYGDVNGLDFWNNSYAIPDSLRTKFGSIRHSRVVSTENGHDKGTLTVRCQWIDHENRVLLEEETSFEFSGDTLRRRIIRSTTLTAINGDVKFGDNKEGLCALRVDRAFETPSDKPEQFTDASGKPTAVPVLNNEGVNGVYRNSEEDVKEAVWGKRAKWVSLSAHKAGEDISICLFDFRGNPGYPSYWHARGYGLFSVNNLARMAYNNTEPENITLLKQGNSITFKHMLLIKTGGFITTGEISAEAEEFNNSL